MVVRFVSDNSIASIGFQATYLFLNATQQCGGIIDSPSGELITPGVISGNNYPTSRDCTWVINAPPQQQIYAQFNLFELEGGADCSYDFVELRNGEYDDSALIGKFCGSLYPPNITTTHNHLRVHFVSDSSVTYRGFRMAYDATIDGCGGDIVASMGDLHSPNYPFAYNHAADCLYHITTSKGARIIFTFIDFDLESGCNFDWVQIFDGPSQAYNPLRPRVQFKKKTHFCLHQQYNKAIIMRGIIV